MARSDRVKGTSAFLAFGRRVSPDDAFDDLVAARGWRRESWEPTFIEACDRQELLQASQMGATGVTGWGSREVLRAPVPEAEPFVSRTVDPEPRLMVASAAELPTLYFAEWHYIDFVLSCVGNVSEAARVLGIRRSTLQRKRKKRPPDR